jgi:hypothetical protein
VTRSEVLAEPGAEEVLSPEAPAQLEFSEEIALAFPEVTQEPEGKSEEELKREEESRIRSEQIQKFESSLAKEYTDTLTGYNAMAGTVGIFLIMLSVVLWMTIPAVRFLRADPAFTRYGVLIIGLAVLFGLAGVHFVLYWLAHRGSNLVKSRELDSIIEDRRVANPCMHLDCEEVQHGWYRKPEELKAGKSSVSSGSDLRWRCSLFDVDLEGLPLCAVCDRYEPRAGADQDFRDREAEEVII